MKLVTQHPHPKACRLACVAMLAGRELPEVIADAGTDAQPHEGVMQRLFGLYGIDAAKHSYMPTTFGDTAIGALLKRHETLLCSVFSYVDVHFAHAVLIHKGDLYDPWDGMNPSWPWHRHIGIARPVTPVTS